MILGSIGSSNDLSIGLRIYLKDEFTKQINAVKNNFGNFRQELEAYRDNLRNARNMYTGLAMGGALVAGQMLNWTKYAAQFDFTMQGVKVVTGATKEEMKGLEKMVRSMATSSIYAPADVAKMTEEIAKKGFAGKDLEEFTQRSIHLAGATVNDLIPSMQILTNTMQAFLIPTEKAAWASDVLALAVNKSNLDLTSLGDALHYAQFTAVNLKQELPDVAASLMTLSQAGLTGSMAGTSLENMYRYLTHSVGMWRKKRDTQAWGMLGLSKDDIVDTAGNLKPMEQILKSIGTRMKEFGYGSVQTQSILNAIFGVRGTRTASRLTQAFDQYEGFLKLLKNTPSGLTEKMLGERMDTPWAQYLESINNLHDAQIEFGKSFFPLLTPLIKGFTWVVNKVKELISLPWVKPFVVWAGLLIVAKTAWWGIKTALGAVYLAQSSLHTGFSSMMASMKTGWMLLTASLTGYNAQLAASIALSRAAGLNANVQSMTRAQAFMRGPRGIFQAGPNRYYRNMPGGGVQRASKADFESQTAYTVIKQGMARQQSATQTAANAAGTADNIGGGIGMGAMIMGMMGKGGAGVLGKAIGFLGGPWFFAITTVLSFLPTIIGLFTDNNEATEKNTEAIDKNNNILDKITVRQGSTGSRYVVPGDLLPEEAAQKVLVNSMEKIMGSKYRTGGYKDATIQINLDGKKVFENKVSNLSDRQILNVVGGK